jgi:hypothetical protein
LIDAEGLGQWKRSENQVRSMKREIRKGKNVGRFMKWSSDDAMECGGRERKRLGLDP